jgi:hypothetical protein
MYDHEHTYTDTDYCVGGACLMATYYPDLPIDQVGSSERFPEEPVLAPVLMLLNLQLSREQAFDFATAIIDANDRRLYEDAWKIAGEALDWTPASVRID